MSSDSIYTAFPSSIVGLDECYRMSDMTYDEYEKLRACLVRHIIMRAFRAGRKFNFSRMRSEGLVLIGRRKLITDEELILGAFDLIENGWLVPWRSCNE